MKTKGKFKFVLYTVIFLCMVAFDQFTKHLANIKLKGKEPFEIIKGVLEFNYLDGGNAGAAWGILQGKINFFIILTIIVCILIVIIIFRIQTLINQNIESKRKLTLLQISFLVLSAGAVGNLIDRIVNSYVVDFIYFKLINFPVFNVADCYITCSTILLLVICVFFISDNEFSGIFYIRKRNTEEIKTEDTCSNADNEEK